MANQAIARNRGLDQYSASLASVVGSIGSDVFGLQLIDFLNLLCGAEHFSVFRWQKQAPSEILAISRDGSDTAHRQFSLYVAGDYWRGDVSMREAISLAEQSGLSLRRVDVSNMPVSDFRNRLYGRTHIRERILLCGELQDSLIGISILRPEANGLSSDDELADLNAMSSPLIALIGKHVGFVERRSDFLTALTSLNVIETTLSRAHPHLPNRESQVCARILMAITVAGIAIDLGIGEETVMTYRKRAYERLNIASQRELLVWYIGEWSRTSGSSAKPLMLMH